MKNIFLAFWISSIFLPVAAQQVPKTLKTDFSRESLAQTVDNLAGEKVSLQSILEKHVGKVIVLEFWAGWCKDCLIGMPASHKLKENNSQVDFIYLSLDKSSEAWKKGIEKYKLQAGDNYWFSTGWKNPFNEYIDLNWIPRYMVIDQKGKIAKYYAISAEDAEIQKTIEKLLR